MQLFSELGKAFVKKHSSINLLDFVSKNSFCTFLTFDNHELSLSHINLIQHNDVFFGHLSKGNSQAKQLENGSKIFAIFKENSKETKNHQAVHMQGTVNLIDDEKIMIEMMNKLVKKYEADKPTPWSVDWSDSRFKSQLKGIVGFYVTPTLIEEATVDTLEHNETISSNSLMNMALSVDMGQVIKKSVPIYTPRYFLEESQDTLDAFIKNNTSCSVIVYGHDKLLQVYHIEQTNAERNKDIFTITGTMICHESQTSLKKGELFKTILIFNGPHSYISPSWYKTPCSVPTWNYTVAHAHGTLLVETVCNNGLEQEITLKCDVSSIDGKFKLNQNRTSEDKLGVIDGLSHSLCPMEKEVAGMMQDIFMSNKL